MPTDARLQTFRFHLSRVGVDLETLDFQSDGTVRTRPGAKPVEDLPELIGFQLGEPIGRGGMGVVLASWQETLEREVAVKVLREGIRTDLAGGLLIHEARITGRLEHPSVVPVHALGCSPEGQPMFAMKRVDGQEWSEWIESPTADQRERMEREGGPLPFHVGVLVQVCHAVSYAHTRGVLHRDLKPANVMIGHFGEVYVLDWGIAEILEDGVVHTADLAGTPAYMAPEQAGAEPLDARSDVYSLGAVLFEVLSGEPPRERKPGLSHLATAWAGEVRSLPDDAPPVLAAIARKALSRSPDARYPDVASFQRALQEYLVERPWQLLAADAGRQATAAIEALARAPAEASRTAAEEALVAVDQVRRNFRDRSLEKRRLDLLGALLGHDLARDEPAMARNALERLGDHATDEQRARVEALVREHQDRARELARLKELDDLQFGAAQRRRASLFVWAGRTTVYLGCFLWRAFVGPVSFGSLILPIATLAGLTAVGIGYAGMLGTPTRARKTHRGAVFLVFNMVLCLVYAWGMGLAPRQAMVLFEVFGTGTNFGTQAVFGNPRLGAYSVSVIVLVPAAFLISELVGDWAFWGLMSGVAAVSGYLLYWADLDPPDEVQEVSPGSG